MCSREERQGSIPRLCAFYHSTTFLANKSMLEIIEDHHPFSVHTTRYRGNAFRVQVSAINPVFLMLLARPFSKCL